MLSSLELTAGVSETISTVSYLDVLPEGLKPPMDREGLIVP